jgi:hypothetical protein
MSHINLDSEAELRTVLEVVERMAARMNAQFIPDNAELEEFKRVSSHFTPLETASSHVSAYRTPKAA